LASKNLELPLPTAATLPSFILVVADSKGREEIMGEKGLEKKMLRSSRTMPYLYQARGSLVHSGYTLLPSPIAHVYPLTFSFL
jgi:hypothetical protein